MHGVMKSLWTCDLQTTKAADHFLYSLLKRPGKKKPAPSRIWEGAALPGEQCQVIHPILIFVRGKRPTTTSSLQQKWWQKSSSYLIQPTLPTVCLWFLNSLLNIQSFHRLFFPASVPLTLLLISKFLTCTLKHGLMMKQSCQLTKSSFL